ncbi:MAG: phosphatidylglycerophosphatase A [Gammaproteobacteria bacterium]|nr:phosphatidylglycerophosphatase A [Gammaproteobacteria bacterium]
MTALPKPNYKNPIHMLAFGLGSGLFPKAPGTMGTIAALPIYWFFLQDLSVWAYVLVLLATMVIGTYVCEKTSQDLNVHDHSGIVIDEWIGMWITMFLAPQGIAWLVWGFILFRIFDIAKPWPIKWFDQHVKGGFGIMMDDVVAALAAWGCVQLTVLAIALL